MQDTALTICKQSFAVLFSKFVPDVVLLACIGDSTHCSLSVQFDAIICLSSTYKLSHIHANELCASRNRQLTTS